MKRIAAPMVGVMASSTVLTLAVIPAVYSLWKERELAVATATREYGSADVQVVNRLRRSAAGP